MPPTVLPGVCQPPPSHHVQQQQQRAHLRHLPGDLLAADEHGRPDEVQAEAFALRAQCSQRGDEHVQGEARLGRASAQEQGENQFHKWHSSKKRDGLICFLNGIKNGPGGGCINQWSQFQTKIWQVFFFFYVTFLGS